MPIPVFITGAHAALDVCRAFAQNHKTTAFVHPMDATAMTFGVVGGRWRRGPAGITELQALSTTLLLGHRDARPVKGTRKRMRPGQETHFRA